MPERDIEEVIIELDVPLELMGKSFEYKFTCPETGDSVYYTKAEVDRMEDH